VKRYVKKWPERLERVGFWFSAESAAAAVQEEGLGQIILQFAATLTARHAAKVAAQEEEIAAQAVAKLKTAAKPKATANGKAAVEPSEAEPKKADVKKVQAKNAKAKNATPKKASIPLQLTEKGPLSDQEGGAAPAGGAVGGALGKVGTDTSRAKKSTPKKNSLEKPSPEKSPAKKQPAKARDGKAGNVKAHDTGAPGIAPQRSAASGGGADQVSISPARVALPDADSAQPAIPKKAPPKKAGTKKAAGKKAGIKKAARKSGLAEASGGAGTAGTRTPARPGDDMASDR
ncbi:MAG: hypothetical protein B7Y65_03645, partial [Azorhizobium sp. 35-67-15]